MSKDGYYGDFGSFAEEEAAYRKWSESQEPDVVPCKCGNPMYETEQLCDECKSKDSHPTTSERKV
jgi:hypothetical protein